MLRFLIVLAMFFWGANWTAAKILAPMIPPQMFVWFRFSLVALMFVPVILYLKLSFKVPKSQWLLVVSASLLTGAYQWLFFEGLQHGFAGAGGVIVTTLNPVLTFLMMSVISNKRLKPKETMGLLMGLSSAVFFIELWRFEFNQVVSSGTLYFLVAALCWSLVTIIGQYIKISPIVFTFYMFALVAPTLLLGIQWQEIPQVFYLGSNFWWPMLFLTLLGAVFATSVFFYVAQKLGAKVAASYIFLVPTSAVLVALIVLHEPLVWTTLAGGGLALGGVYLLNQASA